MQDPDTAVGHDLLNTSHTPHALLHRFFIEPSNVQGSTIVMTDLHELHHLRRVLRLKPGDRLCCFDGSGAEYTGVIASQTPQELRMLIEQRREAPGQLLMVSLAQSLLKADRFEWTVEKATELGVARIIPLMTRHGVIRFSAEQARNKHLRWQRIAQAAAKQCRRSTLPSIDLPQSLETLLRTLAPETLILMPTLAVPTVALPPILTGRRNATQVVVLIGPEGDFTPQEIRVARDHGAHAVSLGPLTLRSETAAVAALAMLQYAYACARVDAAESRIGNQVDP